MTDHGKKAEALFLSGMNCAQAVMLAFQEELGLDREALVRMTSSMGGGMAGMRGVCGAISSLCLVAGALMGPSDPTDTRAKAAHYARVSGMVKEFEETYHSIQCKELLAGIKILPTPSERTPEYYATRPCARYVGAAARILDEHLTENR